MVFYSTIQANSPFLKTMYESRIHSDVQLSAGKNGKKIKAHKAVLSSATDYFKRMFEGSIRVGNDSKVIIEDIDSDTLKAVIKFIYCGSVEINSPETATELLKSAHLMELPQLVKCSEKYLLANTVTHESIRPCLQLTLKALSRTYYLPDINEYDII